MFQTSAYNSQDVRFTIRSIELRHYTEIYRCVVIRSVDENKILVKLLPDIPAWVYGTSRDLHEIVLAPRYAGTSLAQAISEWPFTVNICIPKPEGNWTSGPWCLLDIGALEALAD